MSSFLGGGGGGTTTLVVNSTPITGGAANQVLADNGGTLIETTIPFPTNSNLTYYVATTGSDSNPGTIGSPFATLQHALNVVGNFDYQTLYFPTINVAAGTYSGTTSSILFPELVRTLNANGGFVVGAGATTIFWDSNNVGLFDFSGINCIWTVGSFTLDSADFGLLVDNSSTCFLGSPITFTDRTNSKNAFCFWILNGGQFRNQNQTVTLTGDPIDRVIEIGINQAQCYLTGSLVFPGTNFGVGTAFVGARGTCFLNLFNLVITNKPKFQGLNAVLSNSGGTYIQTTTGNLVTDLPGNGSVSVDVDVSIAGPFSTGLANTPSFGPPGATLVPPNTFSVLKDVTDGPRFLACNDSSTVYLSQIGRFLNVQTGVSYTLALADTDGRLEMNNAGANTVTVPTNASVAFSVGTEIRVTQTGAGATTISPAGGVTVHNAGTLAAQWASAVLYKRGTDEWVMGLA